MKRRVLLDTGPLVASLNVPDAHHAWAKDMLSGIASPAHTCEAVLTEACFLLSRLDGGSDALIEVVRRRIVTVPFSLDAEIEAVHALMRRFASVPMALADACLVRMAELDASSVVLTLDSDFRIYRKHGRQVVPTLLPPGR